MSDPQVTSRQPPPAWQQWSTAAVMVALLLTGGLFLRAQRLGAPTAPLPDDHVALAWDSWVFLAPPAPGTQPSPIAPPDTTDFGDVTLSANDLDLLSEINTFLPRDARLSTVPNPFAASRPPTVPAIWEPLAKLRQRHAGRRPLVVLMHFPIHLSPFQTALSWADPDGKLIVVSLNDLGDDPKLASARIAKLIRHEYGHLAGCGHRDDCVMTAIETVAQLDALPPEYCGDCADKIATYPYVVPEYGPVIRKVDPNTGAPLDS